MKINGVLGRLKKRLIFFVRNSSIHGLRHLFDGNLVTRLFWLLILIASMGGLYLLMGDVDLEVKVNFTPDTRYLHWTTIFPGVTVCEELNTKMALRKFNALYPELLEPLNYDHRRYLTDLLFARNECSNAECAPCGKLIACDVPWRTVIEHVHKSCQDMFSECSYNNIVFPCCEYFRSVDSEHGPCFSFNTLQNKGESNLFMVNRTTGPGVLMFRLLSDAEMSIHSPEELSTNTLDAKLKYEVHTYNENRVELLFSIVEIENDLQLKNEKVDVRECRYLHEVPDEAFHNYSIKIEEAGFLRNAECPFLVQHLTAENYTVEVYSYGACRLAYSTADSYKECGCVHPARDLSYIQSYCNYTGMNCWNAYEEDKTKVEKDVKDCLPSCVESELSTIHFTKRWDPEEPGKGTLVEVKMASLPTLRYQRNLLRDNLDLVVAVGGIVGLFFSASILSLLEVFYLILRPPINY